MGFWDFLKKEKRDAGDAIINTPSSTGLNYQSIFGSQQNALQLSTVFRCINIISESIAVLPLGVYTKNGVRVDHDIDYVFRDSDNKLTKFEMIKQMVQSVLIKGNGFIHITRNSDGTVKKLRWLESCDVNIFYEKQSNTLYYTVPVLFNNKKIETVNMIHLKMFSHDGINGVSILNIGSKALRLGTTLENNAYNFFANGCNLSGVLSVASSLTPQQIKDIHKAWDESYVNGSGVAVLQGNMNYQSVSNSAKDNELLSSREYTVKDICRWFGINPVLLGLSGATYTSLEQAQTDFVLHTLLPWVEAIEEEFTKKLLLPSEQKSMEIVLDENYLLRMDKNTEANYYSTMVNNGLFTRNEARGRLGLQPVEGGDELLIPYTKISDNTINNKQDE